MKTFKGIQYQVWNQRFIKFHNPMAVSNDRKADRNAGDRFRIIPDRFLNNPDAFAKLAINTAIYNHGLHEKEIEKEMQRSGL